MHKIPVRNDYITVKVRATRRSNFGRSRLGSKPIIIKYLIYNKGMGDVKSSAQRNITILISFGLVWYEQAFCQNLGDETIITHIHAA